MELLLKRDRLGDVVAGSDALLFARAIDGDDITVYEESSVFSCYIVFANTVVGADRVSGLSLPHLAFGDLTDPGRLEREPIDVIQYIYDSKNKNLLCRDVLDENRTVTESCANDPHYASFTWYSTRRYSALQRPTVRELKQLGDQFKVRLTFSPDLRLIIKPEIVQFPETGRHFFCRSAPMILPTPFAMDPMGYLETGRPVIANKSFCLSYLAIASDRSLTIVSKRRFSIDESMEESLERSFAVSHPTPRFIGYQDRQSESRSMVTQSECDYAILIPRAT